MNYRTAHCMAFTSLSAVAGAGLVLLLISYDSARGLLDRIAADGTADLFTPEIHMRLRSIVLAGSFLAGASSMSILIFKEQCIQIARSIVTSILNDVRVVLPTNIRAIRSALASDGPFHLATIAIILAVGGILRWHYINLPFRTDEAYTYLMFASKPLAHAMSDYSQPNNHLFHTLLVHLVSGKFPSSPIVIRLPAFVFGVLLPLVIYVFGRTFYGKSIGLIAAALASTSFALIFFSVNARGYIIITVLFLLSALAFEFLLRKPSPLSFGLFVSIGTIGMFTMPTMLHAIAGLVLWQLVRCLKRPPTDLVRTASAVISSLLLILFFSSLLYLPLLIRTPIGQIRNHWYLAPLPIIDVLEGNLVRTRELFLQWHGGLPAVVGFAMIAIAVSGFVMASNRPKSPIGLVISGFACAGFMVFLQGNVPLVRVWIYLLPVYLCAVASGIYSILQIVTSTEPARLRWQTELCALSLIVLLSLSLVHSEAVRNTGETGSLPEADEVADYLLEVMGSHDVAFADDPAELPLRYYFEARGVDSANKLASTFRFRSELDSANNIYLVQCFTDYSLIDTMTRSPSSWAPLPWDKFETPELVKSFVAAKIFLCRRKDDSWGKPGDGK